MTEENSILRGKELPMAGIYQFGDPDNHPHYVANNGRGNKAGVHWCCPFSKGHRTPLAAANHLARRMALNWEDGGPYAY